jgi:hypothetical protein
MAAPMPGASSIGLMQEVADQTDEERRKKLLQAQQQKLLPSTGASALGLSTTGYSAALGGP